MCLIGMFASASRRSLPLHQTLLDLFEGGKQTWPFTRTSKNSLLFYFFSFLDFGKRKIFKLTGPLTIIVLVQYKITTTSQHFINFHQTRGNSHQLQSYWVLSTLASTQYLYSVLQRRNNCPQKLRAPEKVKSIFRKNTDQRVFSI